MMPCVKKYRDFDIFVFRRPHEINLRRYKKVNIDVICGSESFKGDR